MKKINDKRQNSGSTIHISEKNMRELTNEEVNEASGGFLAQVGMGMAGMTIGMAGYAITAGISGSYANSKMIGAAVGGVVTGLGGFSPAAGMAGTAIGTGVAEAIEDRTDS